MKKIFIAVLFMLVATNVQAVPVQWSQNGHYYDFVPFTTNPLTWQESLSVAAGLQCAGLTGHLATITSAAENDFLTTNFAIQESNRFAWVGGNESNDNGVWKWAVGPEAGIQFSNFKIPTTPFNYANWGGIEPNDHKPQEDYVMFNLGDTFAGIAPGQWGDAEPWTSGLDPVVGYLVEYEPISQPPVAEAGQDVEAPANTKVVLDGSASYDPDGTITQYVWTRLPDNIAFSSTTVPTCNTNTSTCEIETLGRAEEVIELSVVDNDGYVGKDTLSIYHRRRAVCSNGTIEDDEICDGNSISCLTPQGGYAGTKYCNEQCTAFGDCISGLSCGDQIINGNELCDGNTQSCTTAAGYSGTQSCTGQCDGFGTCTSTLSCGDGICTAPPETGANCAQDCTLIEIIVDNTNTAYVQLVGSWPTSSGIAGYYGTNYLWLRPGTGANSFSWKPTIATAGSYEVFARWAAYPNRATDAKYTITHSSGSTTVTVNQQINGGVWYSLGKFNFSAGTGAKITLTDSANNIVVADAIRLLGGN